MTRIQVIGIGDGGRSDLLPNSQQMIQESDLLIGGERQLSFFPEYEGEKLVIKGGLKDLVQRLKQEKKKTVVLASGDPLFTGSEAIFPNMWTSRSIRTSVPSSSPFPGSTKAGRMPMWSVFMAGA